MAVEENTSNDPGSVAEQTQREAITNYRKYSDEYIDPGKEVLEILPTDRAFHPNFYSRNTIQIWDASNAEQFSMGAWLGGTLKERTSHEITIPNNSGVETKLYFVDSYLLVDEEEGRASDIQLTTIPANTTAHYYCTAVYEQGSLFFHLRRGSQDTRPKELPFY